MCTHTTGVVPHRDRKEEQYPNGRVAIGNFIKKSGRHLISRQKNRGGMKSKRRRIDGVTCCNRIAANYCAAFRSSSWLGCQSSEALDCRQTDIQKNIYKRRLESSSSRLHFFSTTDLASASLGVPFSME